MLEMNAAAAFKDWNPARWIDTAEMTHAFAIGYDWLYNALTPEERGTIREAIVTKVFNPCTAGLSESLGAWSPRSPALESGVQRRPSRWGRSPWRKMCPIRAALLRAVLESVPHGLAVVWSGSRAWPEGPAYGEYCNAICVPAHSASLGTAVGSAFRAQRLRVA